MKNQLSTIQQLKESGVSIRDIAERLSISKYEVEKAFQQLKAPKKRPDRVSDTRPDRVSDSPDTRLDTISDRPDTRLDTRPDRKTTVSHSKSTSNRSSEPAQIAPRDLPSEWHKGVTRYEADFILAYYLRGQKPFSIKAIYEKEQPTKYLGLSDVQLVIDAYEGEQAKKKLALLEKQKLDDEALLKNFAVYVGDDLQALMIWMDGMDEPDMNDVKAFVYRADTVLKDLESFCRKHNLSHSYYEPYTILSSMKRSADYCRQRKKDELIFSDEVISFMAMLSNRPNMERYFYKMLEKGRQYYW